MKYAKKALIVLAILGFSCSNALAMEVFLCRYVSKRTPTYNVSNTYKVSKRHFSNNTKENLTLHKTQKTQPPFNKILETPIIAKGKPLSYTLPKDFFIEERKGVILDHVDGRILHVHQNTEIEKETLINDDIEQKSQTKISTMFFFMKRMEF